MAESRPSPILAALILAAGYSSRMGRFKALLPMGGTSTIERIVTTFRQAGISRVGTIIGHEATQLEPLLHRLDVAAIHNPNYSSGMYSSVQAGLAALPANVEACFLLPVDIPLVRPASIATLAARYAKERPAVVYPLFSGQRGHPPLIARSLFGEILAGDGEGGLRALLQRHQSSAAEVEVIDEGILLDMDTPEDYGLLANLAQHRHLPTPAECEAILALQAAGEPLRRHGRAVAAVARTLATRLAARGVTIDRNLVLAASLLHDVAKGQPAHAAVGAAMVADYGYPVVADVIRQHMAMDFDGSTPNAAAVVFLADKLVREDRRVPLEERFQGSFERFRDQPDALRGATRRYETARSILAAVENAAGAPVDEILVDCGVPKYTS
jgi:molybdenum cofactor cytidylyltransferase